MGVLIELLPYRCDCNDDYDTAVSSGTQALRKLSASRAVLSSALKKGVLHSCCIKYEEQIQRFRLHSFESSNCHSELYVGQYIRLYRFHPIPSNHLIRKMVFPE
ncbi:hypothetical protein TNCV_511931 [Trichonephila clavipes]|nr:hypothetical protein TNCV_511931 [Trichonephila clavipes]